MVDPGQGQPSRAIDVDIDAQEATATPHVLQALVGPSVYMGPQAPVRADSPPGEILAHWLVAGASTEHCAGSLS